MSGMAMGINQTGNDQFSRAVDDFLVVMSGLDFFGSANINNPVILDCYAAIFDNAPLRINGDERSVKEQ